MRNRWIAAGLMTVLGLVWIGQGTGILRGTGMMVGDVRWAIAGVALAGIGAFVGWTAFRSRRRT